jgi:hypothetical protein
MNGFVLAFAALVATGLAAPFGLSAAGKVERAVDGNDGAPWRAGIGGLSAFPAGFRKDMS